MQIWLYKNQLKKIKWRKKSATNFFIYILFLSRSAKHFNQPPGLPVFKQWSCFYNSLFVSVCMSVCMSYPLAQGIQQSFLIKGYFFLNQFLFLGIYLSRPGNYFYCWVGQNISIQNLRNTRKDVPKWNELEFVGFWRCFYYCTVSWNDSNWTIHFKSY